MEDFKTFVVHGYSLADLDNELKRKHRLNVNENNLISINIFPEGSSLLKAVVTVWANKV